MSGVGHLQSGEVFAGFFRVVRLIKAGGMGAVYEVRHTHTNKRHALKVMLPEIVANPDARRRFEKEAQVAAIIDYPSGVVDVAHAGVDEATGMPFLVMEFLVGHELGELIEKRGRLEPSSVVTIVRHVAKALDKAHAAGVVHRDLKPENLFVIVRDDEPPTVKILDFGIAKILAAGTLRSTMAGGTPLYMAPEQTKRSAQIGPATDIWALGLIAYTALVGRPYWEAEDVHSLYGEILEGNYEAASSRARRVGVTLPAAFDAFFAGCVEKDPVRRFRTALDAANVLKEGLSPKTQLATAPWSPQPIDLPAQPRPQLATAPWSPPPTADTEVPTASGTNRTQVDRQWIGKLAVALVLGAVALAYGVNLYSQRGSVDSGSSAPAFAHKEPTTESTPALSAASPTMAATPATTTSSGNPASVASSWKPVPQPSIKGGPPAGESTVKGDPTSKPPLTTEPTTKGDPTSKGDLTSKPLPLDAKCVETVVASKRAEVRKNCYEPWSDKGDATVKVTLAIAADGRVTSSEVLSSSGEKAIATCVQKLAKSWLFRRSSQGGTFNVPYIFGS